MSLPRKANPGVGDNYKGGWNYDNEDEKSSDAFKRHGCMPVAYGVLVVHDAVPTMGFSGGYEDTHIRDNIYYVNVQTNGFTSPLKAAEYFHRRAKELCREHGFSDYRTSGEKDTSTQAVIGSYGSGSINASSVNKPSMAGYVECINKKKGGNNNQE